MLLGCGAAKDTGIVRAERVGGVLERLQGVADEIWNSLVRRESKAHSHDVAGQMIGVAGGMNCRQMMIFTSTTS